MVNAGFSGANVILAQKIMEKRLSKATHSRRAAITVSI
jgi:hypothetical protein